LLFTFIMNIAAISLTVIVINRNYRTPRTHQMPFWVRYVFLNHLPRLLFMERPDHEMRWRPRKEEQDTYFTTPTRLHSQTPDITQTIPLTSDFSETYEYTDSLELPEIHRHQRCRLTVSPVREPRPRVTTYDDSANMHLSPDIVKAAEALRFISKHLRNEDEYNTVIRSF
jgi:nicotinic acetylcholine receptor